MTSLDPRTQRVIRDLAKTQHDLKRQVARLNRGQDAGRTTIHHGALQVADDQGKVTHKLGQKGLDPVAGPKPARPAAPAVTPGQAQIIVATDGDDFEGNSAPEDWAKTRIYATTQPPLAANPAHAKGSITEVDGETTIGVHAGIWHVGVVWVTESGQVSELSDVVEVEVEAPVDAQDIEDTLAAAEEKLNTYRDEVAAPRFHELETGLGENAQNISDATERLSTAEQTLSPLPGRITTAEQEVQDAKEEATKAAAAAVEANNRAMTRLANGNFENGLDYWDYQNVTLDSTAHSGQQAAQIDGWLRPGSSFPVVPDQIWELSLYHQYDVTVELQAIDGDTRTALSTHHLDGDSSWSDSGALRVTIPADVHMLSFTITGTSAIVDDITLRDVTDVVRLEEAANANRQKAEQAIAELAILQLAVDGEGGLKDRLTTAETVLETKADTSALNQLDQKLAGDLAAFEAHYTRIWRQPTPPPPGTHYEWLGKPHASVSVRLDGDGNETARNYARNPSFETGTHHVATGSRVFDLHITTDDSSSGDHSLAWTLDNASNANGRIHQNLDSELAAGRYVAYGLKVRSTEDIPGTTIWLSTYHADLWTGPLATASVTSDSFADQQRVYGALELPEDVTGPLSIRPWINGPGAESGSFQMDDLFIAAADTEEEALALAADYFDGDTASDRAHDLWYNTDGVPHEWVNGQGWTELSDDRINQLQTDVVQAAQTAYLDRLVVRDEIITPETITNRLWADLGVFNRLQAREGWIGGTNLADGAVTAEKIHATRELITRIMGAEWAYISERLVVDGDLIANNASIINAALQTLSVTEMANFVTAFADELFADEFTARSAVLARAIVAAPNFAPPPGESPDEWQVDSPWTLTPSARAADGMAFRVTPDSSQARVLGPRFPVTPGETLKFDFDYGRVGSNRSEGGSFLVGMMGYTQQEGGSVATFGPYGENEQGGGTRWELSASWDTHGTTTVVVPEGVTWAAPTLYIYPATGTPIADAHTTIYNFRTTKMVDGRLLVDGTVTTRHIEFTETLVGNIAELLHLVVDRIDVNTLWADQTWQNAGYFGAEGGGFRTTVNGQGVLTEQEADGEYLPASQLGGPEQALTFWDENQEPTATVERTGDASFQLVDAARFEHQGRPLFSPDPYAWHDGPILDALPRGIVDKTPPINMAGVSVSSRTAYGFLEVAGRVEAGRVYRVSHTPFLMQNDVAYYGEYTYAFSTTDVPPPAPHTESDRLEGVRWRITQETRGPNMGGEVTFEPQESGIIRILLVVGRASSGTGIDFHHTATYNNPVLTLEDIGPARRWNGVRRYAAHGGSQSPDRDPVVLSQGYTTAWTPAWQQVYRGNSTSVRHNHTTNSVIQGFHAGNGSHHSSILGGYQTNQATRGDHAGQTMTQALDGRTVISGRIIAVGTSQNQTGVTNFYWHAHSSAPSSARNDIPPPNYVGERRDRAGTIRVTQLPQDAIDAINNGVFQGVTIHPVRPDGTRDLRSYHGLGGVTDETPVTIELTYEDQE